MTKKDTVIDCPRAHSDMTPCVARDGKSAATEGGLCVGCNQHAADLLTDLVPKYIEAKNQLESYKTAYETRARGYQHASGRSE